MDIPTISSSAFSKLGYYVYLYINPLDGQIFYIGKGKDDRYRSHLSGSGNSEKSAIIRELRDKGLYPTIEFLAHGLQNEEVAFQIEMAAIDLLKISTLSNVVRGKSSSSLGRASVQEIIEMYDCQDVEIIEPAIIFLINKTYREDMSAVELYDATRGYWKIGSRREKAKYAVAVCGGVIKEVYSIVHWMHAGKTFNTRGTRVVREDDNYFEFIGNVAEDKLRKRYINKSARSHLTEGSSARFVYVNC